MNLSTNQTNLVLENWKTGRKDLQTYHVFYITFAVAAFKANFSLCLIHACSKRVQRTCNIFLVTHYVANTVQTLTAMMYFAWPSIGNTLVCILNISFSSSVLCVPSISLITLSKTLWVTRFTAFISGKLPFLLLTLLLLLAVGVAIPPYLGWGSPVLFFENPASVSILYSVFVGIILSVVPLVIICVSNYKLFKRVQSYEQRSRRESEPQFHPAGRAQFDTRRREGEAKWIMLLQIVLFIICLVPLTMENILASSVPRIIPEAWKYSFNFLAQTYCLFSPLLYGFSNREVRQACKCGCNQKTFVLQGTRLERRQRRVQIGEGHYRSGTNDRHFVVTRIVEQSCDELSGALELNCAGRERLVHFTGVSVLSADNWVGDNDTLRAQKPVIREKRPITAEVSPLRRHCTRKQDGPPRRHPKDESKVRFESECTDKQRKKYIATPSIKRMRQIKRCLSDISLDDLQSSFASVTGSEFESQQHVAPHFTNYSDPMRSAGFRQVLTGKGKRPRICSLHRAEKYKPKSKAFMERRCSIEADYAIRTGC